MLSTAEEGVVVTSGMVGVGGFMTAIALTVIKLKYKYEHIVALLSVMCCYRILIHSDTFSTNHTSTVYNYKFLSYKLFDFI